MDDSIIDLDAYYREHARLQSLIDTEPATAIEEARSLSSDTPTKGLLYSSLKASVLIDAGGYVRDKRAIEEGIELFRKLLVEFPEEEAGFHYNIGNGLLALADQTAYKGNTWYLETAAIRCEARSHLQQAISSRDSSAVRSTAFTNLGNALYRAYRWVEAYDAYTRALTHDPSNAVASTGAARILLGCINRGIGGKRILQSIAATHLKVAKVNSERIGKLAGPQAHKDLAALLQMELPEAILPDLKNASDYEKFVAGHRLTLSPTIEGLGCSIKRWDSLHFKSIVEPVSAGSGVPPLFAMLNVMKSDFLASRYLTYQALTAEFPESGFYTDTLDYAVYGIVPSLLSLAQRACIDLLDKVAAATTEYFSIPGDVKVVYFWKRWFDNPEKRKRRMWLPSLRPHIDRGNTAIIALADISFDLGRRGFLVRKQAFRHSSTHRFTVLHDIGCDPSRKCAHIEHCGLEDFKKQLIESLQLARAALIYFVEMVSLTEEVRAAGPGKVGAISVPSHHYIRGEDDNTDIS